mgnify:CR=1 FL=1
MFTGIVEEKGKVSHMQLGGESGVIAVKARKVLEGTKIGDCSKWSVPNGYISSA